MIRRLAVIGCVMVSMGSVARAECVSDNSNFGRVTCMGGQDKVKPKAKRTKGRHQATDANGNAALAIVHSKSGKTAKVRSIYAGQFQGLIDDLESAGYRIDFMGGWRKSGSCRVCDAHPAGRAIDINQTARNRVTRRFPSDVTRIAARHGVCHGAIWGDADRGHFEIADASRSNKCRAIAQGWPRTIAQHGSSAEVIP